MAGTLAGTQKKAVEEDRTLVFIDDLGFYLLPMVVRSYAPRGLTPILKEYLSRDHLATIAAITPQARLRLKAYEHAISSVEVAAFLEHLQHPLPGLLLVVWDGSPTHRSKMIKSYLSNGAAKRLHLERFPGYAPDLSPIEWVWSYLKVSELAKVACDTLPELARLLHQATRRLQHRPRLINSFIHYVGYQV